MKNLAFIAISIISFACLAQEIKVSNPIDQTKVEMTWKLEKKDKGYVLYLPGDIGTNGHYIDFVNEAELENFFNKALDMFNIELPENTFVEAEIDWTEEYLKFCTTEGSKKEGFSRSQHVSMSRSGYNLDNVFIRSYVIDSREHHLTAPSGSSYFTKEEIVVLME